MLARALELARPHADQAGHCGEASALGPQEERVSTGGMTEAARKGPILSRSTRFGLLCLVILQIRPLVICARARARTQLVYRLWV